MFSRRIRWISYRGFVQPAPEEYCILNDDLNDVTVISNEKAKSKIKLKFDYSVNLESIYVILYLVS